MEPRQSRTPFLLVALALVGLVAYRAGASPRELPEMVAYLARGGLTPVGDVKVSVVDPQGNGISPLGDMSPQLPSPVAIGAGTSTELFPIVGGSHLRITCNGVLTQYRCGIHPLTAVSTDNDILAAVPLENVTIKSTYNACAFFSAAGTTCKVAVRDVP